MSMKTRIWELCKRYSDLADEDINKLEAMGECLQAIANAEEADVFIDCLTRTKDKAIVVAEARPHIASSMYLGSVVGKYAFQNNEPAVIRSLELGVATNSMKAITQENKSVVQSVTPIQNHGRTIGVIIIEKDITEKVEETKQIKVLAEGYDKLISAIMVELENPECLAEYIDEGIIMVDSLGIVRFRNNIAKYIYENIGYKQEIIGMDYSNICLDNRSFQEVMDGSVYQSREVRIGKSYFKLKIILLNKSDCKLVIMIKDMTLMKEKEKELILKSVAIKEIHHRVKNNLQTIASLLRLQSRRSEIDETKEVINEAMNRILSIASTHELLAQEGLDEVYIMEVIGNIKNNALRCFADKGQDVTVEIEGDDFKVSADTSTSVALIINELLQNSMKYAFKGRERGEIKIVIKQGLTYSNIYVIDDGIGFERKNVRKKSLGLSIVERTVTGKLHGNISIDSNSSGTKVSFDFKN